MKTLDQLTNDEFAALCAGHTARLRLLQEAMAQGAVVSGYLQEEANRRLREHRSVPAAVTTLLAKIGEETK